MMGSEPIEEEIPVEKEDLSLETQIVFDMYDKLQANWEGMSGTYLGKNLVLLPVLFKQFNIENYIKKYAWHVIPIIDSYVAQDIANKIKRNTKGNT